MSGERLANCPGCGATLEFRFERSVLRVCDHCRSLLVRKGADLEKIGTVAELVAAPSPVRLGLRGRVRGGAAFTVAGRLQLRWEHGTWNEWHLAFSDGSSAWLSESMGRWHVMRPATPPPRVPPWSALRPDARVEVAGRSFVVTEVRAARFASAEGDLPELVRTGDELHYADLSGPRGELATLDYGAGDAVEAFYAGDEMAFADLGFDRRDIEGPPPEPKAAARALTCPRCGGALALRAPDSTQRIGCPWCGSLLDATNDLAVLRSLEKPAFRPGIPLGRTGTLDGVRWTVIGALERSVTFDGVRYPWREYILHADDGRFRFLVESSGHWSLVGVIASGTITSRAAAGPGDSPSFGGTRFRHFQGGTSRVDAVAGECYWEVSVGDRTGYADFIAPPRILSCETERNETAWSSGVYLEPGDVWAAFSLPDRPPPRKGVGANQPSPWSGRARRAWTAAPPAAMILLLAWLGLSLRDARAFRMAFPGPDATTPAPESIVLTEPFTVDRAGLLAVDLDATVDNSWFYVDSALIDLDRGIVVPFDMEVGEWHGTAGGESWSEGRRRSREIVGGVRPGRYQLRLAPQGDKHVDTWAVTVTAGVTSPAHFALALLALFAWPVVTLLGWLRFEHERWSESDHPWTGED